MRHLLNVLIFASICCTACNSDAKLDAEQLIGTWNGVDWKVQGQSAPDRNAAEVYFVFEKMGQDATKGRYIATYGNQKERGEYQVKGDKLYTTADDQKIEKVVRILQLNADTLILDMNRGGVPEALVLVEKH